MWAPGGRVRLLATSDWHLDATTSGLARLPELEAYVSTLAAVVVEQQVDLVVHLGDLFDPGSFMESHYQRTLLMMAANLTQAARLGTVWLAGNHDVHDTTTTTTTLSPLSAVEYCWGVKKLAVYEQPKVMLLEQGVVLLCLPYVSKTDMDVYGKRLKGVLEAAGRASRNGRKLVVLSHLSLPGMHPGSEEEMPYGRDLPFPVEEVLALKPALVLQGHYHARQTVDVRGLRVEVVGAPIRFTFGERDDGARGYLLVDL